MTTQAYDMVADYGLGDELRTLSYYDSTGRMEQSLQKPYSEKTAEKIDNELQEMVDYAYENTQAFADPSGKVGSPRLSAD